MDEERRDHLDGEDDSYEPPAYELIGPVDELTMGGIGVPGIPAGVVLSTT